MNAPPRRKLLEKRELSMPRTLEPYQMIERSIIKKYRDELWKPFVYAVKKYELIQAGDKIAVCISGGKDSMLMAKLMQELHRHSDVPFELVFLVMDPGYNAINRQRIESNAALLHITITVFETNIFEVANSTDKSPCYLCARMRRGYLYSKAKELGCNKIALGHHFNDVIETTVMGMFYGLQLQAMLPKLHSDNFEGMELIRPMYCIHEEDIIAWRQYNQLEFIQCACRFTENCTICDNGGGGSKRQEIKTLLRRLKRDNPNIEKSIFNSIHAVALDTSPATRQRARCTRFWKATRSERHIFAAGKIVDLTMQPRPNQIGRGCFHFEIYLACFMLRPMRFFFSSTSSTTTLTTSPTDTTSDGCLMNLSATCEMCTSPS